MVLAAGDGRGRDGINFIRVDKSAGATQSLDRSQFRRHLKRLALKIIMLGIKKGSNVWVMPFKCNKSLYLSRFMDRCIYVDTGPLILLTNEGSWHIQQICPNEFPNSIKIGWSSKSPQAGEVGWHGCGGLRLLWLCHCPWQPGQTALSTRDPLTSE